MLLGTSDSNLNQIETQANKQTNEIVMKAHKTDSKEINLIEVCSHSHARIYTRTHTKFNI